MPLKARVFIPDNITKQPKEEQMLQLKKGDVIGIFSPSSPVTWACPRRFQRAKKYLTDKGFKILEGSLTGKNDFYRSGSIQARARELNDLIRNPKVSCIMSTIGGMNSNSLLPYVDYKALSENPKVIVGYSDVTALLLGIYAKTKIQTYYGPALVASFGEFPPFTDITFKGFQDVLVAERPLPYSYKMPSLWTDEYIDWEKQQRAKTPYPNAWLTVNCGRCRGRLIGGNLNTMQSIWGSPYMPAIEQGDVLLIEDSLKNAASVERGFAFLKINGVFDKVGGIILGKHELFDNQKSGRKPYQILQEVLDNDNIPLLADFDCSHTHPMFTMPIGSQIELDATNQKVTLHG